MDPEKERALRDGLRNVGLFFFIIGIGSMALFFIVEESLELPFLICGACITCYGWGLLMAWMGVRSMQEKEVSS